MFRPKKNVKKAGVWFARPDSLNDPFECQMIFPEYLESIWERHNFIEQQKNEIKRFLKEQLKELGVFSLSKTRQNQLMWSHYADEHKGFCIGFNEEKLINMATDNYYFEKVEYQSKLPYKKIIDQIKRIEYVEDKDKIKSIVSIILVSIVGVKYTNWSYEKEVRLIRSKFGAVKFYPSVIVSIAFGLKMEERDKLTLRTLLSGSEWGHLRWYQAEKAKDKFGLVFKKIN